jgi:hypothetical protein
MNDIARPITVKVQFDKLKAREEVGSVHYDFGTQIACTNTSKRKLFDLHLVLKGFGGTTQKPVLFYITITDTSDKFIPGGEGGGNQTTGQDVQIDFDIEIDAGKEFNINIYKDPLEKSKCEVEIRPTNKKGATIN